MIQKNIRMLLFLLFWLSLAPDMEAAEYQVTSLPPDQLHLAKIKLPDISKFSTDTIHRLIAAAKQKKAGTVTRKMVREQEKICIFYSGEDLLNIGLKQKALPTALVIEKGVMTIKEVSKAFPGLLVDMGHNEYLAKLPIMVSTHATLIIENSVIKLSMERGAFLVNGGELFLQGGSLLGWSEKTDGPAWYSGNKHAFRPFFVSLGASRTYFNQTRAAHLGYLHSKSYGITLSSYHVKQTENVLQGKDINLSTYPTGWFLNSYFSDIYYGFYCYEARDIAVINNTYADNIIYGIVPHDRSSHLTIAGNTIYGTKIKHGIIISRQVDNSFIFHNICHDNKRSGIMLDRQSRNNQVVGNTVYRNGSDGITLHEVANNLVAENVIYDNKAHGIRLRNSEHVTMRDNIILNNGAFGVYLHTRDLIASGHKRDLNKDPYRQDVSAILTGGIIAGNRSGSVFAQNASTFTMYSIVIDANGKDRHQLKFGGDLARYHNRIVQALWGKQGVAVISRNRDH